MKKKIMVVTGGAGFIGSHLTEKLVNLGYHVKVIDNLSQGHREWVHPKAKFFKGSISDKKLLKELTGINSRISRRMFGENPVSRAPKVFLFSEKLRVLERFQWAFDAAHC